MWDMRTDMTAVVVIAVAMLQAATVCSRDFEYFSVSHSICYALASSTLLGAPSALHLSFSVILNPDDY